MTLLEIGIIFLVIILVIAIIVGLFKKLLFILAVVALVWFIAKVIQFFKK